MQNCEFVVLSNPSALGYSSSSGDVSIEAILPTGISGEQANKLFDLMPQMEYCNFDHSTGS